MEGIIEMLKDFKSEIQYLNEKSKFPWVNIYRKRAKKKLIHQKSLEIATLHKDDLDYENTKDIAILFNELVLYRKSYGKFYKDSASTRTHSYSVDRAISGNNYNEFTVTVYTDFDNAITKHIYRYSFLDTDIVVVNRVSYMDSKEKTRSVTINKEHQGSLTCYYYENYIFRSTVIADILCGVTRFLES